MAGLWIVASVPILFIYLATGVRNACVEKNVKCIVQPNEQVLPNQFIHISRHDHVALATCRRHWEEKDNVLLHQLRWPVSAWKLPNRGFIIDLYKKTAESVKTKVLIRNMGSNQHTCITEIFNGYLTSYLLDWLLIEDSAESKDALYRFVCRTRVRNFTCGLKLGYDTAIDLKTTSQSLENAFVFPYTRGSILKATTEGKEKFRRSELRNSVLRVGHTYISTPSHNYYESEYVLKTLDMYNVTLTRIHYKNTAALYNDLVESNIDISGDIVAVNAWTLASFSVPAAYIQVQEKFYVKGPQPVPVSVFDILLESTLGLCLLVIAFASILLTLAVSQWKQVGSRPRLCSDISGSFMFLLASFYSTSAPLPRSRRWVVERGMLYGVWLVAILPLSNYFRSELVSRLSLRRVPDVVDTLDELEDALDNLKVNACVVKGTMVHTIVKRGHTKSAGIYAKLHAAIQRKQLNLVNHTSHCIECAKRVEHACITRGLRPCRSRSLRMNGVVESKEKVLTVWLTTVVRKNFPLLQGYRDYLRRIFEGSLLRWPDLMLSRPCERNLAAQSSIDVPSNQLADLERVFLLFSSLLGIATVVFLVELAMQGVP